MPNNDDEKDVPFLGVLEPEGGGNLALSKLTPGCLIMIHETDFKETAPMLIGKITMKAIDLECACLNPRCSFKVRLRLEKTGHHPTPEREG